MIVYAVYTRGTKRRTVPRIRNLNFFSTITGLSKNTLKLETKKPVYPEQIKKIEKIRKALQKIPTIKEEMKMYPVLETQEDESSPKMIHIFADIDSTLTHTGISALNRNVKSLIQKFTEKNCNFYFCTGRSYQDVTRLMRLYDTGEYGIAENGGIILGIPKEQGRRVDRKQPNKLIQYLLKKKISFTVDPKQKNRRTEYVLMRKSITETELKKAIRLSTANVEYHASKNTYHISQKGINKGTAIEFLTSSEELDLDPEIDEVIAIGDSGLDIPMFKYVEKGYFVGKPTPILKKKLDKFKGKVKKVSEPPNALVELYQDLFPYS